MCVATDALAKTTYQLEDSGSMKRENVFKFGNAVIWIKKPLAMLQVVNPRDV